MYEYVQMQLSLRIFLLK